MSGDRLRDNRSVQETDECCPPEAPDCCGGICTVRGNGCGIIPGDCKHLCEAVHTCLLYLSMLLVSSVSAFRVRVVCTLIHSLMGNLVGLNNHCIRKDQNTFLNVERAEYSKTDDANFSSQA